MTSAYSPLTFPCGITLKNRMWLAPLTNLQSHADGTLSEAEVHWLTMRAKGGYALTMTAATHVQLIGQGFPGQLGIFSDEHLPGLTALAGKIKAEGSVPMVQLHHAGLRADKSIVPNPVAPSENLELNARALTTDEVDALIKDFITGAVRAQKAGFSGVDLHGAHNYLIGQFLSAEFNQRQDKYGGSLANRCRFLLDIVDGIRNQCGKEFLLGVRLTPERHGIPLLEAVETVKLLVKQQKIDFLDMSLWDIYKEPIEEEHQGRTLMSYFTEIERGNIKLGVVGHIYSAKDVEHALAQGADFVMLGRAAIIHHDFPEQMRENSSFAMHSLPVTRSHLRQEGLSDIFIEYMGSNWKNFVAE